MQCTARELKKETSASITYITEQLFYEGDSSFPSSTQFIQQLSGLWLWRHTTARNILHRENTGRWARFCLGMKVQNVYSGMNLMWPSLVVTNPWLLWECLNLSECWVTLANTSLLRSSFNKCGCRWFTLCQCSFPGLYKDLPSTVKLNTGTCLGVKFEASRTCGSILI